MYSYKVLRGRFADGRLLADSARAEVLFLGGPHKGHKALVWTSKHSCGAYGTTVECECGRVWENAMNGCWQNYHQRPEAGDKALEV
jgi:hypothetical protein